MPTFNSPNDTASPSRQDATLRIRELLRRLIADDHDAWVELVDSHTGLLLTLARKTFERHGRHASRHDHEDVVETVWRDLLAHNCRLLHSCLDRGEILPLLHTLVRNRCVDMMRAKGTEPFVAFDATTTPDAAIPAEAHQELPPDDDKVVAALESLPAKERSCVTLFYLQNRGYREIAELTGIPVNSIGPTMRRALDKLRIFFSV